MRTLPERPRRILVVEDELTVASLLVDILRIDGYEVDQAEDGAQALELLDQRPYDAIVSDARMPVLDGADLYRELGRRHPELVRRIAFITGDLLRAETREFLARTDAPTLDKPAQIEDVRRVVRQLLGNA